MNADSKSTRRWLFRETLLLQLKLLLGAARDLALTPVSLVAAAFDFLRAKDNPPRWFPLVLRLGEQSDHWIDLWRAGRAADATQRENVDALLMRIEGVVRDPKEGARHARVLKRWAERSVRKARQRMAQTESDATGQEMPEQPRD
jgi:hypothetical protein